ncbi:hypothetical protein [Vibrio phage LP.2]|nr:hypothetical protein [Vibrio phage LP.2]
MEILGIGLYSDLSNVLGFSDETILTIVESERDERDEFFVIGESFEDDIYTRLQDRLEGMDSK